MRPSFKAILILVMVLGLTAAKKESKEPPGTWKPKTMAMTMYITDEEELAEKAKKLCKDSEPDQVYEIFDPGVGQEYTVRCGPPMEFKTRVVEKPEERLNNRFRALRVDFMGAAVYAILFSGVLMASYLAAIRLMKRRRT